MASRRALLVGIDQYPDPRNNLNSCVADTLRFRGLLLDRYGFQAQDITLLHNGAGTLANVRMQLAALTAGVLEGDQVVYFQSSHGYRYVKGSTYTEVLCLYDQFLEDTELVSISRTLPPGSLTCVVDACHAAGLEKLFFAPDGLHAARGKVWQPPADQAVAYLGLLAQATSFKSFGRSATSDTGAVAKQFSAEAFAGRHVPAAKSGEAQAELNGVLAAACLADQTAAAGSPPTDGLSAFTWALCLELDQAGTRLPAIEVQHRVTARLEQLNMRQTPSFEAPMAHGDWLTQPLISFGASPGGATGSPALDEFLSALGIPGLART